jgi:histidinol-phosphate phosphatase family protein
MEPALGLWRCGAQGSRGAGQGDNGVKAAVILAGGMGSRMAAELKGLPKALAAIDGQPLLHRQLRLLSHHGFSRAVLLLHHGAAEIWRACSEHEAPGLSIEYIEETQPRGTAGAVFESLDRLPERFLVMYGDTVVNVDLTRLWHWHLNANCAASLLVHPNDHPQDSDLVEVDGANRIVAFHPYPHPPGIEFNNLVNGALYVVEREALRPYHALAGNGISDFAKHLFPAMLADGTFLSAYRSREYIKDTGTPARLASVNGDVISGRVERGSLETRAPAVFLDRDGTINHDVPYLNAPEQFQLIPGVADAIARLNRAGYLTVVVTNQPVIARGEADEQTLRAIHNRMDTLLGAKGAYVDALYYCPHHPDRGYPGERAELKVACTCRKPAIGLISQACEELNIALEQSWFVGDSTVDVETARRAGLKSVLVRSDSEGKHLKFPQRPDFECLDLAEAARLILDIWPVIEPRALGLAATVKAGDVIAIGGPARSGKSTWASAIAAVLIKRGLSTVVIGLDGWLYDAGKRRPGAGVLQRYDMNSIQQFLYAIPRGSTVSVPLYERQTRTRAASCEVTIGARDVIILEGVVALMVEGIERLAAHRIYVERAERSRYELMRRDYEQRGWKAAEFAQVYQQRLIDEMPLVAASRGYATTCLEAI